jgi:mersacidin/lichenicidin family type 2 lantibiotic
MSHTDTIRAWKDEAYRLSLSEAERENIPDHPAGLIELPDSALGEAAGGTAGSYLVCSCVGPCPTDNFTCETVPFAFCTSVFDFCPLFPVQIA